MAAESIIRSSFLTGDRLLNSASVPSSSGSSWVRTSTSTRRKGVVSAQALSNCHLVLGLNHSASKQEIKRAYRNLALQYHPDVCKGNGSEDLFTQINLAYESLMNNMNGLQNQTSTQDFPGSGEAQKEWLSEGFTFEDIFGESRYESVEESVFQEVTSPRSKNGRSRRKYKNSGREDW